MEVPKGNMGGRKGVRRVHSSSGTVKKKYKSYGKMFLKTGLKKLERKTAEQGHTWWIYTLHLCVSESRLLRMPSEPWGCQHQQQVDVQWPGVPTETGQYWIGLALSPPASSQHGATILGGQCCLPCWETETGGGGADANSLQAQQSCQEPWEDQHWGQGSVH